ncbi:MAG: pirin family protein [Proteobacteria bacterium]|nr:pirin family protein [Pseudomonadota bacterium]
MFTVRKKEERGSTEASWLKSQHSFSFGEYYDPQNMGFGHLRVINEDWIIPESGFGTHGHKNMEIVTYILAGELTHKDSLGTGSVIRPGEVQLMSAGKGILHSEVNASPLAEVHLLQIWIMPNEQNTRPKYQQKAFPPEQMQNRFRLIVSPNGENGSLMIKQDAKVLALRLAAGQTASVEMSARRKYWLQVAQGGVVRAQNQPLEAGDALAIDHEQGTLTLTAHQETEVLLFDLPQ